MAAGNRKIRITDPPKMYLGGFRRIYYDREVAGEPDRKDNKVNLSKQKMDQPTTHSKEKLAQDCEQIIESIYFNSQTGLNNLSSEQLGDIKSRLSKIEAIIERSKEVQ